MALVDELKQDGIELEHVDIGGGLGITYQDETPPTAKEYADVVIDTLQNKNLGLIIEPGRSIVGNAGVLITEVQYINAITLNRASLKGLKAVICEPI